MRGASAPRWSPLVIVLPWWLAAILFVLAAIAVLDRLLLPGARWFLRRRLNRAIERLNARLHLHLRPFNLTRRDVLVDRLTYDPKVLEAVEEHMSASGEPRDVVMRRISTYAHEIVPSFKPGIYFRAGYAIARAVAQGLYRVRVGYVDDEGLSRVDPGSSVVFVMNHRSNMDYVLVSYLAADRTALSYAVGEWARVWPLQTLVRSMGAYFIRRSSGDPLYRRVLERYVQMATEAGVVQALFPEGGLSRDGSLREPRLGLIGYIVRAFDPSGTRDIVFVPVGLNYDRVFEDRTMLIERGSETARGALAATLVAVRFALKNLALMVFGRWHRFGYACVNFGTPVSVRTWFAERGVDPARLDVEGRRREVDVLGRRLMDDLGSLVPVLPVSVVASVLVSAERPLSELELRGKAHGLIRRLRERGAHVYVPRTDQDYAVIVGLRMLVLRRIVREDDHGGYAPVPAELPILRYYANSIAHLTAPAAPPAISSR